VSLWDWIGGGAEDEDEKRRRQLDELLRQVPAASTPQAVDPLPTTLAAPAAPLENPADLDARRAADDENWRRIQAQAGQRPIADPSTPRLWDASLAPATAPSTPAPVALPQQASDASAGSDMDLSRVDPGLLARADAAADRYGIDRGIFRRQLWAESKFDPSIVNPNSGAAGIGQFMPQTAAGLGINPLDPDQAIDGAARYLRANLDASGGDYRRALAAYNWGPGNAKSWDGRDETLPDETRRYLGSILGGGDRQQQQPTSARSNGGQPLGNLTPDQHQMSLDEGLDEATAWAVCGPAAAIAFARRTGQNPTMRQALALAQEVGWTVGGGMAGPASEQKLLSRMGIASKLEQGAPDWGHVIADVRAGNPVIIDAGDHYMVAEGYDPQTGKINFGKSASILRAANGQSWFSPDELPSLSTDRLRISPEAAIYLDNPNSPLPSTVAGRSPGYYQPTALARIPTLLDQAVQTTQQALTTSQHALDTSLQLLQDTGLKSVRNAPSLITGGRIQSDPLQLVDDAMRGDMTGLGMDLVDPKRRSGQVDPEQSGLLGWGQVLSRNAANATAGIISSLDSLAGGALSAAGFGESQAADFFHRSRDYFDRLQQEDPRFRAGTHAAASIDIWDPKTYADPETYAAAVGQALPSVLASMATGAMAGLAAGEAGSAALVSKLPLLGTRAEALGSALFTLPTAAGSTYEDLKKLGWDDTTALFGGLLSGGLQSALEVINPHEAVPVWKSLFSEVDLSKPFWRRVAGAAREFAAETAKEAGEEGAQQVADNLVQKWFGSDKSWFDQVPENMVMGGLGNLLSAPGAARALVGDRAAIKNAEDRALVEKATAGVGRLASGPASDRSDAAVETIEDHPVALRALDVRVADLADKVDDDRVAYDDWRTSDATMRSTQALGDRVYAERTRGITDPIAQRAIMDQVNQEINGRQFDRWLDTLGERRAEVEGRLEDFKALSGARDDIRRAAAEAPPPRPEAPTEPEPEGQPRAADEPKYSHASTQLDLDGEPADRIRALQSRIDPADLAEHETDPHVTVKYGLRSNEPDDVRSIVQGTGPATMRFGKTSVFPDDGERGSDVVKVDVDGPRLRMLNDQVGRLPNGDVHPTYTPHATVAYVRPGAGQKYAGLSDLDGLEHTAHALTFSDRNGVRHQIPLAEATEDLTRTGEATDDRFRDPSFSSQVAAADRAPRATIRIAENGAPKILEVRGQMDLEAQNPDLKALIDQVANGRDLPRLGVAINNAVNAVVRLLSDPRLKVLDGSQGSTFGGFLVGAVNVLGSSYGSQGGPRRIFVNPHEILAQMLAEIEAVDPAIREKDPSMDPASPEFREELAGRLVGVILHEVLHGRYNTTEDGGGESHPSRVFGAGAKSTINQIRAFMQGDARTGQIAGLSAGASLEDQLRSLLAGATSDGMVARLGSESATLREEVAKSGESAGSGPAGPEAGHAVQAGDPGGDDVGGGGPGGHGQPARVRAERAGRPEPGDAVSAGAVGQSDDAAGAADAAGSHVRGIPADVADRATEILEEMTSGDPDIDRNGLREELKELLADQVDNLDGLRAIIRGSAPEEDAEVRAQQRAARAALGEALGIPVRTLNPVRERDTVAGADDTAVEAPVVRARREPRPPTEVTPRTREGLTRAQRVLQNQVRVTNLVTALAAVDDDGGVTWVEPRSRSRLGGEAINADEMAEAIKLLISGSDPVVTEAARNQVAALNLPENLRVEVREAPDGLKKVALFVAREGASERSPHAGERRPADERVLHGIGTYVGDVDAGVVSNIQRLLAERRERALSQPEREALAVALGVHPGDEDNHLLEVARKIVAAGPRFTAEPAAIADALKMALAEQMSRLTEAAREYQKQVADGTMTQAQADAFVAEMYHADELTALVGAGKKMATMFGRGLQVFGQATRIQLAQQAYERSQRMNEDLQLARAVMDRLAGYYGSNLGFGVENGRSEQARLERHVEILERNYRAAEADAERSDDEVRALGRELRAARAELESLKNNRGPGEGGGNGPGNGGDPGEGGYGEAQAREDASLLMQIFGRWNPEALSGMNMGWDASGDARHVRTAEQLQQQDPLEFMRRIMAKGFTTAPERQVRAAAARANRARRNAREREALEGNGDLEAIERMDVEDMVAMLAPGHLPTFRETLGGLALEEQAADKIKDPTRRAVEKARIKQLRDRVITLFQREITKRMRVERHNRTAEQQKMTPAELEILVNELVGAYDAQSAKRLAVLLANDGTPEMRAERIVRMIREEHRGIVNDEAAALRYWIGKAAEVERTYGASDPALARRMTDAIDDAVDRLAEHAAIGGGEKAAEKLRSQWASARGGAGVRLVDAVIKANVGHPINGVHPTTSQRNAVDSSHWRGRYGRLVTAVLENHDDLTAVAALDAELSKLERQTSNPLAAQAASQIRRMVELSRLRAEARAWFREVEDNPTDRWTRGTALAAVAAVGKLIDDPKTPAWLRERWADLPYTLEDQLDRAADRGADRVAARLLRDERNAYKQEAAGWVSKLARDPQDPEALAAIEDVLDRMRGDGHITAADAIERVLAIRTADATSAVVQAGSDLSNSNEEVKAAASEIAELLDRLIKLQGRDRGANIAPLIQDLYAQLRTMGDYGWAAEERARNRVMAASLERMGQQAGVIGTADYLHFIQALNPDDPKSIARALRFIQHPSLMKYLRELGVINLLSSPATWGPLGTNSVSQMLTEALMVARWPFEYLGDLSRYVVQKARGKDAVRTRYLSELRAAAGALGDLRTYKGLADAASIMLTGHSASEVRQAVMTGDARSFRTEYLTQLGAGWREAASPAGKVKYAALYTLGSLLHAVSTRPLAALDAIHASTLYSINLAMQAEREARVTGRTARAVLDDPKSSLKVIEAAGHLRDFALLQLPSTLLRKLIRNVNEALQVDDPRQPKFKKVLELLWHGLVPFTTVPMNATKQGVELSVVGATVQAGRAVAATARGEGTIERAILDEARDRGVDEALIRARGTDESLHRAAEAGSRAATRAGSAAIGFLLFAAAVIMKSAGWLTGDPPDDENERERWESHNIRPRSIYLGPLGWRSYDSTAFSIPFAMVANGIENTDHNYKTLRQSGYGEGASTYLAALVGSSVMGGVSAAGHNFFLGPLAELANLPTSGRQQGLAGMGKVLAGSAQGMLHQAIPVSGLLGFLARWGDDYTRDTADPKSVIRAQILNRTANGLPDFLAPIVHPLGLETRGDLPIKLDPRGRSVPNDFKPGLDTALGAKPATDAHADPMADLLKRYDLKIGDPPDSYSLGAQGSFVLTPSEKRKFASDVGAVLDEDLKKAVNPDGSIGPTAGLPAGASDDLRRAAAQQALQTAIQRAHQQAGYQLWLSLGDDDAARRHQAYLRARAAGARKTSDYGAELR
jgi:2'-5' RNA ligase